MLVVVAELDPSILDILEYVSVHKHLECLSELLGDCYTALTLEVILLVEHLVDVLLDNSAVIGVILAVSVGLLLTILAAEAALGEVELAVVVEVDYRLALEDAGVAEEVCIEDRAKRAVCIAYVVVPVRVSL